MAKKCPNCKAEISRYQEYCYRCGEKIKRTAKRPKHQLGIHLGYFLLGLFIPPLGYVLYFFFMRDKYDEARSAFIGAIISSVLYFIAIRVFNFFFAEPIEETDFILYFQMILK